MSWWYSRSKTTSSETEAEDQVAESDDIHPAAAQLLQLQRDSGNQAVQHLITSSNAADLSPPQSGGQPLPQETREQMQAKLGESFDDVRVHIDEEAARSAADLGANAYTQGRDIYFASGKYAPNEVEGQRLLAHELTHTLQQESSDASSDHQVSHPTDSAEIEATAMSDQMTSAKTPGRLAPKATRARISLQPYPTPPTAKGTTMYWPGTEPKDVPPTHVFEDPKAWTAAGAPAALDAYWKLVPGNRKSAFAFSYPKGSVTKVLKALPASAAAGAYQEQVRELLRWVEEAETRRASGKKDDEMADIEAKFVYEKNKKAVEASGKVATEAEIESARQKELSERSFHHPAAKSRWELMSPDKRAEWTKNGNEAIAKVVEYAAKTHPALKLDASMFKLAFHEIDKNSPGALAQGGTEGGKRICAVGFKFVDAVKVNPAYALSTVVHELSGHVEFNDPGQVAGYQQELFLKAAPKISGYKPDPTNERASYGYHESEIYSLLRELPYWTPVSAKDKVIERLNPDPKNLAGNQIDEIKSEWEPKLAVALMRGLYKRFSLDPRIEKMALTAFEGVIRSKFTDPEAKEILK